MKVTRRVAFLPAGDDGCALWRMWMIHLRYPGSGYFECRPGEEIPLVRLKDYQVAVVQRLATKENFKALELLKKRRIRIVYDLDDNFWSLPRYNPAYGIFRNPTVISGLEKCAREADWITTSTEHLARVVGKRTQHPRITVVENRIDPILFHKTRRKVKSNQVTIGWAGTPTHHIDLDVAMNALAEVMRTRSDVNCQFMGAGIPDQIIKLLKSGHLAPERVRWLPWVAPKEYPAWLGSVNWDLSLAPLAPESEFNRSKSNIKMLEATALEIPCLASPAVEYKKFCHGSSCLEYLLCRTRQQWFEKINAMADNPKMRQDTALYMMDKVESQYRIEKSLLQWNEIFESV